MKKSEVNVLGLKGAVHYALKKIVQQGKSCIDPDTENDVFPTCLYKSIDGKSHCAVGWLLNESDETAMSFMGSIDSLCGDHPNSVPEIIRENVEVFELLQRFHDKQYKRDRLFTFGLIKENFPELIGRSKNWQKWIDMGKQNS